MGQIYPWVQTRWKRAFAAGMLVPALSANERGSGSWSSGCFLACRIAHFLMNPLYPFRIRTSATNISHTRMLIFCPGCFHICVHAGAVPAWKPIGICRTRRSARLYGKVMCRLIGVLFELFRLKKHCARCMQPAGTTLQASGCSQSLPRNYAGCACMRTRI